MTGTGLYPLAVLSRPQAPLPLGVTPHRLRFRTCPFHRMPDHPV
ncbi:hypothetical protein [Streptomyces azureus]|nr:hypothetical protein [Streptomyces azureus]